MPVRMVEMPAFGSPSTRPLRAAPPSFQLADHLLEVGHQQVGSGGKILRRGGRNCRRCSWLGVVVGKRPVAGAGLGAVQILAPQQEFDGMIAGRDVGLDVAGFLQRAGQEFRRDLRGVDLLAVDLDRLVGDHIGGVERVLVGFGAVALVDIVDQALRPAARRSPGLPSRRRWRCRSDRPRSAGRACAPPSRRRAPPPASRPTAWRSARRRRRRAPWRWSAHRHILPARCRHRS